MKKTKRERRKDEFGHIEPWFDWFLDTHPYFPLVISCVGCAASAILLVLQFILVD